MCTLRCLPCKQRPFDLEGKVGQKTKVGPFARRVFSLRIETQTCCKDLILELICTVTYCVSCLIYYLPVSLPDETPRRELKIRRVAKYFWRTSKCFIWWWNTVSNVWYYFSNKMILEGEIKDAKISSFSSDFQTLIKH